MNNIIITGASGLVATELIFKFLNNCNFNLFLLTRNPANLRQRYVDYQNILCFDIEEFRSYIDKHAIKFDILYHTAFARSSDGKQVANALKYTQKVLDLASIMNLHSYVNISSQSVYGLGYEPLWKEDLTPAPNYMYALGKYSTELMTELVLKNTNVNYANIRLASVYENARFVNIFVKNAFEGKPIIVMGGRQICSFIDVRDVANALFSIFGHLKKGMPRVYNISSGRTISISEIAEKVKKIGTNKYSLKVEIKYEPSDAYQNVGMDNSLFCNKFGWKPDYDVDKSIISLFELNKIEGEREEKIPISFKYCI